MDSSTRQDSRDAPALFPDDIRRVRLIQYLSGRLGLNLAGVEFALGMVEKLLLLRERLGAATQDTPLQEIIEQELAALFESTGLPP